MTSKPENAKSEHKRRERQDWLIVLLILLLGFACVLVARQQALRFAPTWQLDTDMGSNIDLDSEFMTGKPQEFFAPVDPAILTQPAWAQGNVFLTPGAADTLALAQQTSLPTSGANTVVPTAAGTTVVPTSTVMVTNTTVPTNTLVWIPIPATSKPNPGNTATNTSPPPPSVVNLDITQVEDPAATTTYAANSTLTYLVTISNTGPDGVAGAVITDNIPAPIIASWTWVCDAIVGTATGCDGAASNSSNFSDSVNLPSGTSIRYRVTAVIPAGVSGNLTNIASINAPTGYTEADGANNTFSDTNSPGIDMQIAKIPGAASYTAGGAFSYTITVTNNSSFSLNGVSVTDAFSAQLENITWNCALCPSSGAGNINDTINMPPGSVVTYTVNANTNPAACGPLLNTANVTIPAGFTETNPGNETATTSASGPSGGPGGQVNIGGPDSSIYNMTDGGSPLVMVIPPIIANGDVGAYDLVYYEMQASGGATLPATNPRVDLDWVQIEISPDGSSWQTVFYWGDMTSDGNTNVALPVESPPGPVGTFCATETDNCQIPSARLYNNTGVAIDIDAIVPPGNYSWIRITSPASPGSDGADVNAIQVLP